MEIIKLAFVIALGLVAFCAQAQTQADMSEVSTQAKSLKNWPANADELLKKKQINFTTSSTRRRIDLQEKTYQVFGTRSSGMCISDVMPVKLERLSEYEVEIHIPPKFNDDPSRQGMCQGYVILVNLQVQTFTRFEYFGDRSKLTGPFSSLNIKID